MRLFIRMEIAGRNRPLHIFRKPRFNDVNFSTVDSLYDMLHRIHAIDFETMIGDERRRWKPYVA